MTTKQEVIAGLEMIVREGLRTTKDFSADDWAHVVHDEEGGWTRKQVYCHLIATADVTPGFIPALAGAQEGQDVGAGFDIGEFNAQQVAAREGASPEELRKAFETSYRQLIKAVEALPEEQLALRRRFGAFEGTIAELMQSVLVLHGLAHVYLSSTRAFT
jgi:hypothetical protein